MIGSFELGEGGHGCGGEEVRGAQWGYDSGGGGAELTFSEYSKSSSGTIGSADNERCAEQEKQRCREETPETSRGERQH